MLHSWVVPVWAVLKRRRALLAVPRRQVVMGLTGGAVSLVAYGLVLLAQTSGALAAVAALREVSIAFGVLLGAFVLHEAAGPEAGAPGAGPDLPGPWSLRSGWREPNLDRCPVKCPPCLARS